MQENPAFEPRLKFPVLQNSLGYFGVQEIIATRVKEEYFVPISMLPCRGPPYHPSYRGGD